MPRKRDPMIPLDLEKIVLKALAKDPLERYATAGELAEDLGRFLDDRPVLARRPSLSNRAAKWARRHRPAVVSAGLLFASLLIGLATAGWWSNATLREYNRRLKVEIDRADRHAREAEERALKDRRNAAAARLGRASQALNRRPARAGPGDPPRPREGSPGESLFPFAWRYLWQQARCRGRIPGRSRTPVRRDGPVPGWDHAGHRGGV